VTSNVASEASRLVVLGSCGAWPEAGRACAGFVLEHDGFRVVLDLGYATLPRLLAHLGSSIGDGVDAVVVTHRHPDHAIDLHGLFRARSFGRHGAAAIPLYAARDVLDLVVHLENGDEPGSGRSSTGTRCPATPTTWGRSGCSRGTCRTSCLTPAYG
jgi:ribonuclease BN (tRNA processing enzyme)